MRRREFFGVGLLWIPVEAGDAPSRTRRSVELHIATDGDELAFRPRHLNCPTDAEVRLFFHHTGEIINDQHNWVLLKAGREKAFLADADNGTDAIGVVPTRDLYMILAATPLCGRGHTVLVEFIAPLPGDYPFVCSVAGHGETMRGVLTVSG
jgi:azurin